MVDISVVVPVFHNEESLPDLTAALERAAPGPEFEYVFVDDGSEDGSWRLLGRCRSSGGKDLRASSGTVELSLFSSLLATLPCWRSGPSSGSLASRRLA